MSTSRERMHEAVDRLSKWRAWFAGWQLGTRPATDGPTRAVRDATEARLILRAEMSALTALMLEKGVFTEEEWAEAVADNANHLNATLTKRFPGVETTRIGLSMTPAAAETMRREGFPP